MNIRQIKKGYAAQRRKLSGKGVRASKEWKRITRNEKQTLYRTRKKKEAKRVEKEIISTPEKGWDSEIVLAQGELFFTALNYRNETIGTVVDQYRDQKAFNQNTKAYITDFDGNFIPYNSDFGFEAGIQALYVRAGREQHKSEYYPLVDIIRYERRGVVYFHVKAYVSDSMKRTKNVRKKGYS